MANRLGVNDLQALDGDYRLVQQANDPWREDLDVARGQSKHRLDMGHGFLKSIIRNQEDRNAYEQAWQEALEGKSSDHERKWGRAVPSRGGEDWSKPKPWRSFLSKGNAGGKSGRGADGALQEVQQEKLKSGRGNFMFSTGQARPVFNFEHGTGKEDGKKGQGKNRRKETIGKDKNRGSDELVASMKEAEHQREERTRKEVRVREGFCAYRPPVLEEGSNSTESGVPATDAAESVSIVAKPPGTSGENGVHAGPRKAKGKSSGRDIVAETPTTHAEGVGTSSSKGKAGKETAGLETSKMKEKVSPGAAVIEVPRPKSHKTPKEGRDGGGVNATTTSAACPSQTSASATERGRKGRPLPQKKKSPSVDAPPEIPPVVTPPPGLGQPDLQAALEISSAALGKEREAPPDAPIANPEESSISMPVGKGEKRGRQRKRRGKPIDGKAAAQCNGISEGTSQQGGVAFGVDCAVRPPEDDPHGLEKAEEENDLSTEQAIGKLLNTDSGKRAMAVAISVEAGDGEGAGGSAGHRRAASWASTGVTSPGQGRVQAFLQARRLSQACGLPETRVVALAARQIELLECVQRLEAKLDELDGRGQRTKGEEGKQQGPSEWVVIGTAAGKRRSEPTLSSLS